MAESIHNVQHENLCGSHCEFEEMIPRFRFYWHATSEDNLYVTESEKREVDQIMDELNRLFIKMRPRVVVCFTAVLMYATGLWTKQFTDREDLRKCSREGKIK